jgi:protein TonB
MRKFVIILLVATGHVAFGQNEKSTDVVYTIVETMPVFPGGDQGVLDFVVKNIEYPAEAKNKNITGKVYVSYVVNKKGKVTDVKVVRGAHPLLDKAAVECIKKLKGYKPGTQKGKPVNVQFTIPINFQLN